MLAAAARPFDALDAHRVALAARLRALPTSVTSTSPRPGAWSLAQIVDHFQRIESSVRPEGRDGSRYEVLSSPARAGLVRGVLALPVRIGVPPGADAIRPADAPDLDAGLDAWAARRQSWRDALDGATAADLDRMVVLHPLAGRFRWPDTLRFLLAHHRHHDAQIERTLAAVSPHHASR